MLSFLCYLSSMPYLFTLWWPFRSVKLGNLPFKMKWHHNQLKDVMIFYYQKSLRRGFIVFEKCFEIQVVCYGQCFISDTESFSFLFFSCVQFSVHFCMYICRCPCFCGYACSISCIETSSYNLFELIKGFLIV